MRSYEDSNYSKYSTVLWQPLVTKTNKAQTINFSVEYHCGDHKRTQQGVSAEFLPYLFKLQMVHANTNLTLP